MYTLDELAAIVQTHGDPGPLPTIKRRIESWHHRDGLLPEPARPAIPGKRGRGPLIFPEAAARVVVSLNRWRHRVPGVDSVRGYLWLEGFDYLELDPESELQATQELLRNELRLVIPSLPPVPDIPIGKEQREHILDELNKNVTQRLVATLHLPENLLAILPAIFGLYNSEELKDLDNILDDTVKPLLTSIMELMENRFGAIFLPDDRAVLLKADGPIYEIMASIGMQNWSSVGMDWAFVRSVWQFICLASDIPESLLDSRIRSIALFLHKIRDTSYEGRSPWTIAQFIAILGTAITPERRSSFVDYVHKLQAMRHSS